MRDCYCGLEDEKKMEVEEGEGIRKSKSKRFDDGAAEVDYKTKAGTAWSHSYLNQKPWHPLSYPNQRRKWIAEQTHANRLRRSQEVAREYAQEQEFFRQTALISKKEKEKVAIYLFIYFCLFNNNNNWYNLLIMIVSSFTVSNLIL